MREWKRADDMLSCGAEPQCQIRAGELYCVLKGNHAERWAKVRCARHAGTPSEEPLVPAYREPSSFVKTGALAKSFPVTTRVARDWAKRQANDHDD